MKKFKKAFVATMALLLITQITACSSRTTDDDSIVTFAPPSLELKNTSSGVMSVECVAEYEPVIYNTEEYSSITENTFLSTKTSPFSTFAADVDTASYANIRRMIKEDGEVNPSAVRIEEMINYFKYNLPAPINDEPFSVTTEISKCPWNDQTNLLFVGLQAKEIDTENMPQSNLVFLIDVSGSMDSPEKLPLVKRSFMTLVETLNENDKVSVITYSAGEEVVLEGVSGENKTEIMDALENLYASGSTDGQSALKMAYEIAHNNFIENGNNRIILATDGDFNVGITSEGELKRYIKEEAKNNIYLSVLGYGMGNYKDNKMETLADNGNGNYYYIDDIFEARKVLVEEAGGTLLAVAKDVKLQVEFNPSKIKGYRLIGYENRLMNAEDFADDKKDGGEIGAGHQVVALYEIVDANSDFEINKVDSKYQESAANDSDEFLTVNIRYKDPDKPLGQSTLLQYTVDDTHIKEDMSDNLNWASGVAATGMILSESEFAGNSNIEEIRERLRPIANDDYKEEFIYLLRSLQ